MVDWLNHQWLEPFGPAKCLFGRFLLTLSRIKRPQVMFMGKLSAEHSILVLILFYWSVFVWNTLYS